MSSSPQPSPTQDDQRSGLPLRRLLVGLTLLTVAAAVEKVVIPSAPMPAAEATARIRMDGYRISVLSTSGPRRGRDLSLGTMRQFRLEPLSGAPPLTLTLVPVRSRTGTQLSKTTLGGKDLGMEAVGTLVPGLTLHDQRIVFQPITKVASTEPQADQLAVGRGAADPAGSTTRLQTCLTSSGFAAFYGYLLRTNLAVDMTKNRWSVPQLLRFVGLQQTRYECLAVQLKSGASAGGQGVRSSGERRGQLEAAWRNLRVVLVGWGKGS